MSEKRFGVGCDHAGFELKRALVEELVRRGYAVNDFGAHAMDSVDYPDFAHALARSIESGEIDRGLLVCGTGVGMSIAVNRFRSARAVVCSEPLSARMSRKHNDANVLCLGARVIGPGMAVEILDAFLTTEFEGGRHAARVAKLNPSA